jgi:hypothetical protein
MSANIGAEKVREISSRVESAGKGESLLEIVDLVPLLSDAFSEFIDELTVLM